MLHWKQCQLGTVYKEDPPPVPHFLFLLLSNCSIFVMLSDILAVALLATSALAHGDHEHQIPIQGPHKALWYNTLPGDGGTQVRRLTE